MLRTCKRYIAIFLILLALPALADEKADLDEFFRAVTDGRTEVVAASLKAHPDWVERELFDGIRPLYRASVLGRAAIVDLLLAHKADPAALTKRGSSPLQAAGLNGHLAVAMMLIAYKAPLDAADEDGDTALHLAVRNKHLKLVKELLRNGANPSLANKMGRTPLHEAAGLGMLELTQALVEAGAELSPLDKAGYSPLGWARTAKRNSYGDVGGYLEAKGAKDLRPAPKKKKK